MDCLILPLEVFQTILTYLDLDSVKALRLTNRRLAGMCIGPRFLTSLQQPTLDVSSQNLRSLHALACNPSLSKRIHTLTLLATSLDSSELEKNVKTGRYTAREFKGPFVISSQIEYSPEELSKAISDLSWLREQQEERANESSSEMIQLLELAFKGFNKLDSIHLDGALIVGRTNRESAHHGKWHPLWMRASHILSMVLTATVQSGISVKKLDVYRDTPRCCIPSGHITTYASHFRPGQLEILGKGLESLKLSMSGEIDDTFNITESDNMGGRRGLLSREDARAVLAGGTPGIASLLKPASALRELDLSFRHTLIDGTLESYDRIIESIAQETQFPRLEKCALSGFMAKGESILLFLQRHANLQSLTLHECNLTTGSWTPIMSHLDQSMPKLEFLSLSNLYGKHVNYTPRVGHIDSNARFQVEQGEQEVDGMVNLHPVWDTDQQPRWRCLQQAGGKCVHTRSFTREELKKGLVFRPLRPGGRIKGSSEHMQWGKARRALYGPP
ncbi:hypothetical protein BDV32DRAFT_120625 [Aspergillus pseudonomiae]|uniref:Uncharacterized protein n=1 Tax=Aspergillus pseudonomiae TaxID=1506151 RepID=A0A5N6I6A8_9EURO|nr:uncharacterized protein BDV37DRAFT_252154 [Aspergillus pseudonomiae]KAB8262136.1 hypothetical protein BDV32DRAFT_120625 [Aspergillus pseudonomiae]KAE8402716.1 hypothetical protein BDV37DRAFT_252154 [Aspergillus pseudonomiae]